MLRVIRNSFHALSFSSTRFIVVLVVSSASSYYRSSCGFSSRSVRPSVRAPAPRSSSRMKAKTLGTSGGSRGRGPSRERKNNFFYSVSSEHSVSMPERAVERKSKKRQRRSGSLARGALLPPPPSRRRHQKQSLRLLFLPPRPLLLAVVLIFFSPALRSK